jgi:ribosomal subunit interface protein
MRISGKNLDIGQALRQRIDETVNAIVTKYLDMGFSGQVTVSKSGRIFETECALHLDSGHVVEARGADADAQMSFTQAAEHLDTQLRRYGRRLKSH